MSVVCAVTPSHRLPAACLSPSTKWCHYHRHPKNGFGEGRQWCISDNSAGWEQYLFLANADSNPQPLDHESETQSDMPAQASYNDRALEFSHNLEAGKCFLNGSIQAIATFAELIANVRRLSVCSRRSMSPRSSRPTRVDSIISPIFVTRSDESHE